MSECDNDSANDTINNTDKDYGVRLLLTTARSLIPKIDSLIEAFHSLDLNVAGVTETWFKGGKALHDDLRDLEGRTSIRVLHRSRDGRSNKTGGGVALAFRTANSYFKTRNLKQISREFEVLGAVGKVGKVERIIVIFVVYIPLNMQAPALEKLKEEISAEIVSVKKSHKDPIIIVGGDMNKRDLGSGIREVKDFDLVRTGPTRGNSTIDLMFLNVPGAVTEAITTSPLHNIGGVPSDHCSVFVNVSLPPKRKFWWVVQWRRTRNRAR